MSTVVNLADRRQQLPAEPTDIHCLKCDGSDFKLRYNDGKPSGIVCSGCEEQFPLVVWRFDLRGGQRNG